MSGYHNSELDIKLRDLSVMYELMSSIGTSLDLQTELDNFLNKLLKRFGFSLGTILLPSDKEKGFVVAASWGHVQSCSIVGNACTADQSGIDEILKTKKPLVRNAVKVQDQSVCTHPAVWERTKSFAYLPLVFEDQVIGLIRLFMFSEVTITEKMVRMMMPLADRLATSINHIQMVTRFQKAESQLRRERDFNDTAMNALTDLFVVIDPRSRKLIRWNEKVNRFTGLSDEDLLQRDILGKDSETIEEASVETILSQTEDFYGPEEILIKTGDGTVIPVEVSSSRFVDGHNGKDYIIAIGRDLRERKQAESDKKELEEQLHQKYKMEAVGLMAGGIAHNFNNSLAIVLGNLEMAQRKTLQPKKLEGYIDNAKTAVLRARDLVSQIMSYSRKGEDGRKPTALATVIEETLKLLHSTNPKTVSLTCNVPENRLNAMADVDPGRVQEALLNLYTNAVHAMNEEGSIVFLLDVLDLSRSDIPLESECSPGRYVRLGVQDSGCGMSPEMVERIFDPFFTTKDKSHGSGIGLATVQAIVSQLGGFIRVSSMLGQGSVFYLYFPLIEDNAAAGVEAQDVYLEGHEHILVVDDEEMIVDLVEEMLATLGYRVTTVENAQSALTLVKADPERFALVITDQTMPGMTGKDLARSLYEVRQNLPVVLCTGYSSKASADDVGHYGIRAFCAKPLQAAELSQVIRRVLDHN